MATCLCKQPCERHKFPMIRSKEDALKVAIEFGYFGKLRTLEETVKHLYEGKVNG